MTICFTGHRPNKLGGYDWNTPQNKAIIKELRRVIINLIIESEEREYTFICGGALGVDQMAFDIVYQLNQKKKTSIQIKLVLAMPFEKQDNNWVEESKVKLKEQKEKADSVIFVDTLFNYKYPNVPVGEYHSAKMQLRNQYMVDNSDVVIAVWDGSSGGTGNCITYANKQNKKIIRINPTEIYF